MNFSSKPAAAPLSGPEQARQGQVMRVAQAAFGDMDVVLAFLDSRHPMLGRRPLDLAIESDAGLAAVQAAIMAERPWPI